MRRIVITSLVLLLCLSVQAEHSYLLTNRLDGGRDYHYIANSHIELSKGFHAEPYDGHEVVLEIDAYGVFPPESGIIGGTMINNTNGVVGSLGGVVDVSLLGGVVYAIPLGLPDGLGGMKPQLNICYNNQERNSLLGWGWNLGGLSSITRTGSSLYHDGQIGDGDRFCLDGKRLLKTSTGNYGANGTSYRTEQDQMSKIVSYQETGFSGPSYFKVWTADGKILYYGHSSDSKALVDPTGKVNIWLLNKVEDRDGNAMEFHYVIEADSYRIDRISYSGNENDKISPAFRVEFGYRDRNDVDISYIGNCPYRKKKLLDRITIFNGEAEIYSYSFTYQAPKPQEGYYYNLLTKIQLDAGDEHLNPTIVNWSSNNYYATSGPELKYNVTTNGIPDAFINAVKFSGDFNGDGFTDVVALRPNDNNQYTQADVFVNRGLTNNLVFDYIRSFDLSSNISWIQVADIDGDGYDDILFSDRERRIFPFPDRIEIVIYLCRMTPSGGFEFIEKQAPACFISHYMFDTHLVGDFFGEGKNSILVQATSNGKLTSESSILFSYDEDTEDLQKLCFSEHLDATRFFPADYNGDGIAEILYKKENGNTAIAQLTRDGNTCHYNQIYNGAPYNWEDCFPGDYNGDGLIDVLSYTSNATQKWMIYLAKQDGISDTSFPLPQNFPYSSPGDYLFSLDNPHHTNHYIKVGDFDGNGCSDLALFKDNRFHVFYGPIRPNATTTPFANTQQISIQAFNLYDNMNVCLGNFLGQERLSFLGPTTLSRLPSTPLRLEVKKITDGMGRNTEFDYDYLMPNPSNPSDNDFYQINSICANHTRHVHSTPVPLRALRKLTTYNVSNKPVVTQCYYEGALIHNQGKGLLGFSKTRQDDYCNGQFQKKTIRQYDINYSYNIILMDLKEETVYDRNDALMARSTNDNCIYTHLNNNKVFIPISHKIIEEYDVTHPDRLLKKEIYENEVETHCSQNNKYNEVISVICQRKGTTSFLDHKTVRECDFQEIYNTSYIMDDLSLWLINRPMTTTSIVHREGNYADICHQKVFSYYNKKPHQIKSVLDIPNDGSHPEDPLVRRTEYTYDPTGNIISQTISTPNDSQTPRCVSFEYNKTYGRRLLTKRIDALNQEYRYAYHPVYNYCTSTTDCNGLTTEFEQDPFGVTASTHHPDNTVSCKALRWNDNSYYQWEKRTGQEAKSTFYTQTGDVVRTNSYDINGDLLMCKIEYDGLGRVIKKSAPYKLGDNAKYVTYEYDNHNRVCRIYHSDGSYESIEHDGNEAHTVHFGLDGSTQEQSKTFNIMGWVIKSTDNDGNSVIYDYRADGKPLWSKIEGYDETRIMMDYDALGNQSLLFDPNYGSITYEYNAFNELTKQMSPKMDEIEFVYDALGRIVERTETNKKSSTKEVTQWHYGVQQGERNLLMQINAPNQTIHYVYDPLLRLSETIEQIMGNSYHTSYTYDKASRVDGITYPSKYHVNYQYTSDGLLKCIFDDHENYLWKTLETNALLQPTQFVTGNGFQSEYGYDPYTNQLVSILTTHDDDIIQKIRYEYDDFSNVISRNDLKNKTSEQFGYDPLNRLTSANSDEGHSEFHYDALGRMTRKSNPNGDVFFNADYSGTKPHAVKSVQAPHGIFPQERMDITFNVFDKVESISQGDSKIHFDYGYDHQRIKMNEIFDGTERSKIYVNSCEFITQDNVGNTVRTFISGPAGVFAVAETINGVTSLHYIHKDHLGSWTIISDCEGNIEQENHFDAWGLCSNTDSLMFDRGFTGHEHIKGTGLINMNGRLYDPLTSSMLSPDNNIQMPDFSQNLNRYAYCLNNPLAYTDPDGNLFIESALLFYLIYCTDFGYEFQKYAFFLAIHFNLHLSTEQLGIGIDLSFGIPKQYIMSYRVHCGSTFYWHFFDDSYSGFENRLGAEWSFAQIFSYSGTTFYQGQSKQTTNSIIIGNYKWSCVYENDYMFNLAKHFPGVPASDNGDRYRSAAARIRIGIFSIGVNLFTGDPGVDHDVRRTFNDPDVNGRETYTISANGDNPDEYRAGLFYVGFGPFKIGGNSEQIRNLFQNKFAHDFICQKDSPYFKVLDRPGHAYFYFGTETGNSLW